MHIGFYCMSLSGTGGVRVTIDLCHALIESGYKVSLIVNDVNKVPFSLPDKLNIYKISPNSIEPIVLNNQDNMNQGGGGSAKSAKKHLPEWLVNLVVSAKYHLFRRKLRKNSQHLTEQLNKLNFDRIVSTNIYNKLEYTELFNSICPTLIHVHNDLYDVCSRSNFNYVGKVSDFYKKFRLIFISKDQKQRAISQYSVGAESAVVYNPIDFERLVNNSLVSVENDANNYLIYVGSLTDRKRVNLIIEALAKAKTSYNLVVLGDGPNSQYLKDLVFRLELNERVKFLGFMKNPYPYILDSKGLVLASSYEGLPTVLIESLVLKTPVIAVDCPTGPKEILATFNSDYLVENGSETKIIDDLASKFEILERTLEHDFEGIEKFSKSRNLTRFIEQLNFCGNNEQT